MSELLEILHPSYVLRNALYGGILTGLMLPLVGVLMYARRMVFLGVALPQVSATGVAAANIWHLAFHQEKGPHTDFLVALVGSTLLTTAVLVLLAVLERHGHGLVEGRIGAVYVFAGAVTILFLASERIPEVGVVQLLRGQIIAISDNGCHDTLLQLYRHEGVMSGPTGGAAVAAALRLAARPEWAGQRLVALVPDTMERYAQTNFWDAFPVLRPPFLDE